MDRFIVGIFLAIFNRAAPAHEGRHQHEAAKIDQVHLPAMLLHSECPNIKVNATTATARMQAATANSIRQVFWSMAKIMASRAGGCHGV